MADDLDLDAIRVYVERRTEVLNEGRLTAGYVTMLARSLNEERALLAEIDRLTADVALLEDVLRGLWHHVPDRGKAVGDLTAEEKERYVDAVESSSRRASEAGAQARVRCVV